MQPRAEQHRGVVPAGHRRAGRIGEQSLQLGGVHSAHNSCRTARFRRTGTHSPRPRARAREHAAAPFVAKVPWVPRFDVPSGGCSFRPLSAGTTTIPPPPAPPSPSIRRSRWRRSSSSSDDCRMGGGRRGCLRTGFGPTQRPLRPGDGPYTDGRREELTQKMQGVVSTIVSIATLVLGATTVLSALETALERIFIPSFWCRRDSSDGGRSRLSVARFHSDPGIPAARIARDFDRTVFTARTYRRSRHAAAVGALGIVDLIRVSLGLVASCCLRSSFDTCRYARTAVASIFPRQARAS